MSITVYDDGISRSIASHIKNPESNHIKFCGIAFECETIEDCKGNLFVKVVRCKDCVYFPEGTGANHDLEFPEELKCPCECEDYWYSWKPADDWYCANGKRKDGEK